jgi:hypothetical protein
MVHNPAAWIRNQRDQGRTKIIGKQAVDPQSGKVAVGSHRLTYAPNKAPRSGFGR